MQERGRETIGLDITGDITITIMDSVYRVKVALKHTGVEWSLGHYTNYVQVKPGVW